MVCLAVRAHAAAMMQILLERSSGLLALGQNGLPHQSAATMSSTVLPPPSSVPDAMPRTLWFSGLSGAGKTSVAQALAARYAEIGRPAFVLDGDLVRQGLNRDLGFS